MKETAVTGANGFLGGYLVQGLQDAGFPVRALSRAPLDKLNCAWRSYSLSREIAPGTLSGVSVLIHCAHDFRPKDLASSLQVNVDGTRRLFQAARQEGVECIIFISSMAAFPGCRSVYGKVKSAAEQVAGQAGAWILKPGTIYRATGGGGKEGLFGTLRRLATKLPIVPLIDGGKQALYLIAVEDLTEIILSIVRDPAAKPPGNALLLGAKHPVMLQTILRKLANSAGKSRIFFPIPRQIILWPMRAAEKLHIPLPFRSDSLVSLCNMDPAPLICAEFNNIKLRGFEVCSFAED